MNIKNTYNLAFLALAILAACGVALVQPLFFTTENLNNVILQSVPLVIFSMAQMVPVLTRGLDLSQGGIVVATSVIFALLANQFGTSLSIAPALMVGLIAGAVNGGLVAGIGISPLVVTLGVGSVLQGLALVLANGQPISAVPSNFATLYYATLTGIPIPVVLAVGLLVALWFVLERMLIGRRIRAVGSNERAAFLSGIPVRLTLVTAYTLSGGITSMGAVLLSSRIASGHPTAGSDTALQAVAATVIGGVSLLGGRGSLFGVVAGAAFLGFVANALNLLNVSSFIQMIATGAIIIAAVVIDRVRYGPKGLFRRMAS